MELLNYSSGDSVSEHSKLMKINFDLTTASIEALLKKGKVVSVKQTLNFDFESLPEADRIFLVDNCLYIPNEECFYALLLDNQNRKCYELTEYGTFYSGGTTQVLKLDIQETTEFTIDIVIGAMKNIRIKWKEFIDQKEAKAKEKLEKEKIETEKRRSEAQLEFEKIVKLPIEELNKKHMYNDNTLYLGFNNDFLTDEQKERKNNLEKEIIVYRQQKEEKAKSEEAAKKMILQNWALQNGSELLKARIEENMNWFEIAEKEYFRTILPNDYTFTEEPNNKWPIKNATLDQIKFLREERSKFPSATLMRYKFVEETTDEYDDPETTEIHIDYIEIELVSLTGTKKLAVKSC